MIFRALFFEHNAEIGQKDHFWMDTGRQLKSKVDLDREEDMNLMRNRCEIFMMRFARMDFLNYC